MKSFVLRLSALAAVVLIMWSCGKEELEPITISADEFVAEIVENPQAEESLGIISASTNRGSLGFEMIMQEPANAIAVDENTGEISVLDVTAFDYESRLFTTAMIRIFNEDKEIVIVARINILDGEG